MKKEAQEEQTHLFGYPIVPWINPPELEGRIMFGSSLLSKCASLVIFTRPLCHDCQTLKAEMGMEGDVVKQMVGGVIVYQLPPDNTPHNAEEVDALVDLDMWITTEFTLPVGVDISTGEIFRGKDEILKVWKEGK